MTGNSRESIVSFLQCDEIKNMNMLYFMENNPVHHLEQIGHSVIIFIGRIPNESHRL